MSFNLIRKNQIYNVITPFREDYAAANGGRSPFIDPFPPTQFRSAENVTEGDVEIAYEKFEFFREWFGQNIIKADPDSCSESLFVVPLATGDVVNYSTRF